MRANLTILELICPTLLSIIKQNAENSATSVSPTTNAIIYDSKLLQTPNCVRLLELAKLAKKKNLFKNNNDSKSPSVNWDFSTKNQKTAHPLENAMNQLNSINETLGQNVISNIKSRSERKVDSSDDEGNYFGYFGTLEFLELLFRCLLSTSHSNNNEPDFFRAFVYWNCREHTGCSGCQESPRDGIHLPFSKMQSIINL